MGTFPWGVKAQSKTSVLPPKAPYVLPSAWKACIACCEIEAPGFVIHLCPQRDSRCHACRIAPPIPSHIQSMPFAITLPLHPYVTGQDAHGFTNITSSSSADDAPTFTPLTANLFQHLLLTSGAWLVLVTETPATMISNIHRWKLGSASRLDVGQIESLLTQWRRGSGLVASVVFCGFRYHKD